MSDIVLAKISKLLQAKAHEPNPMSRGAFVKEFVSALGLPVSTINMALSNEMQAARWGIYKLTPNKRRNVLWAYSESIAEKAQAGPFDDSTGIDPKVQAAEVSKIVSECPEPVHHAFIDQLRKVTNEFIEEHGLSVEEGTSLPDKLDTIFAAAEKYYEKESNNET